MPPSKAEPLTNYRLLSPTIMPASRYWVLGLLTMILISPSDIGAFERLSIVGIYGFFYAYPLLYKLWAPPSQKRLIAYQSPGISIILPVLVAQFICVSISTSYYTGSDIISAYANAISGSNVYSDYQRHFREQGISEALLSSKAIYIIFLAVSKLTTVYLIANFFLAANRTQFSMLAMVVSSFIYLGFGLARGTFFEVFELASAYAYFWSITSNEISLTGLIRQSKTFRFVLIFGPLILAFLFIINALRRYNDASTFFSQCSPNFCFSSYGLPFYLEYPIYFVTVYFGNGAFFMAKLFEATIWYGEWQYLIPMKSVLDNSGAGFGVRDFMCGTYVQCKGVWVPEMATVISIFGLAALPITNWIFHFSQKTEAWAFRKPDMIKLLILYFVFLFLLSLPVANFLLISSSSIVALGILVAVLAARPQRQPAGSEGKAAMRPVARKGV